MQITQKIAAVVCLILLLSCPAWCDEATNQKEKWIRYQTSKELRPGISQEKLEANDPNAAAMSEHIRQTEKRPGGLQKILDQNRELLKDWGMNHRDDPQFEVFRNTGKAVD